MQVAEQLQTRRRVLEPVRVIMCFMLTPVRPVRSSATQEGRLRIRCCAAARTSNGYSFDQCVLN